MRLYDLNFGLKLNVATVIYISQSSAFALNLKEHLMYKHHIFGYESVLPKVDLKINVGHSALYLEKYLMYKHYT